MTSASRALRRRRSAERQLQQNLSRHGFGAAGACGSGFAGSLGFLPYIDSQRRCVGQRAPPLGCGAVVELTRVPTVVRQLLALSSCLAVGGGELAQKVAELLAQLDRPCLGFLYLLQCVVRPAGHPAPIAAEGAAALVRFTEADWPR